MTMNLTKKVDIIAICGKSGAGKDYFFSQLKKYFGTNINFIIKDTTRPRRDYEHNHKDYHFITKNDIFKAHYVETMYFNDWFYGTSMTAIDVNKINIGIFSPGGLLQLYETDNLNIYPFQIVADDKIRVLRQLNREEYPDVKEICRRFLADEKDFETLYKLPITYLTNSDDFTNKNSFDTLVNFIRQLQSDKDKIR